MFIIVFAGSLFTPVENYCTNKSLIICYLFSKDYKLTTFGLTTVGESVEMKHTTSSEMICRWLLCIEIDCEPDTFAFKSICLQHQYILVFL